MTSGLHAAAFAAATFACFGVAHAQMREAPNRQSALFWREVREPGFQRAEELVIQARAWIARAAAYGGGDWEAMCRAFPASQTRRTLRHEMIERSLAYENAIARLEIAQRLAPRNPRVAFLLAYAVESWQDPELNCSVRRRDQDAVALFEAVRAIDPTYRAEDVAFELGILHSRLSQPAAAAQEYERRLALSLSEENTSSVHGNLAEVLMLSGNLNDAVFHYEEAVRIAEARSNATAELTLGLWGLAVALDRLGEFTASAERARRAMSIDSNSMAVLRSRGVFFVPSCELHYIEAVGQLARAGSALGPIRAVPTARSERETTFDRIESVLTRTLEPRELQALSRATSAWLTGSLTSAALLASGAFAQVALPSHVAHAAGATSETQRQIACLVAAARSFNRYLDEGGSSGMWATNARAHLNRIAREIVALSDVR
ncbi:MAG: tetratricopeptide repeat protein [Sandaracinaceae bacterium]|nr:tetratricopeptide repeat protein [Sandaracinaceae bacterium]